MASDSATSRLPSLRMLWCVIAAAAAIALVSARPYAGSWNDGSRLAAIESLVDHNTLAIDDSIFLSPGLTDAGAPPPYTPGDKLLSTFGTQDRLLIDGHWHSDKPYVPQVLLAGVYTLAQRATGLRASARADAFTYLMTLASSGVALIAFAAAAFVTARRFGHGDRAAALLTAAFTAGTGMLPYARHVNAHIQLAAAVMVIVALLVRRLDGDGCFALSARRVVIIGLLAGYAYALESATGGLLCLVLGLFLCWHGWLNDRRQWHLPFVLTLAALPLVALHHAINFHIGGTLGPANANLVYLAWPGSPFTGAEMTGRWSHEHVPRAVAYTLELLLGRKGFFWLNPPMLVGAAAAVRLLVARRWRVAVPGAAPGEKAILVCLFGWCVAVWLLYGALSGNQSGPCYSVRWLLPLLGPGLLAAAIFLRQHPQAWPQFAAFAVGGIVLAGIGWWFGPWRDVRGYLLWPVVGAMVVAWTVIRATPHQSSVRPPDDAGGMR